MIYLIIVSIIWAFSFSIIKGSLTNLDPFFVAFIRLFISLLVFLPLLRFNKIEKNLVKHFLLIGAIQYGFMYITYIYAYQFLKAYEIAALTIFTPIFVVMIFDLWDKKFVSLHWLKAMLAIIGSAIILYSENTSFGFWKGILLIQFSNLFFALGQVYYKKLIEKIPNIDQKSNFAIIYFGAVIITSIFSFSSTSFTDLNITGNQWLALFYLGIVASGLSFFLWNLGAVKVEAGLLAVFNNLKIPLGVFVAIIFLHESTNFIQLTIGTIIIFIAMLLNFKTIKSNV